jgi:hypothetical protein
MIPYSLELNAAVVSMAARVCPKGWDVVPQGPGSLTELVDAVARTGRIPVDKRYSAATIFGEPEINCAFRAWHDWTHYHYMKPFTLTGETEVAQLQLADLATVYGAKFADRYKAILYAEVIGQALAFEITGKFPDDQISFDEKFLDAFVGDA